MYKLTNYTAEKVESLTFSELDMTESELEEILRNNIDMVCDEDEAMLIIGQQVRNAEHGRSDLTAIDSNGNIVLIEIKRDIKDIKARSESFEFQAIRYAASYATITNIDELVEKIYSPYIEKYRSEFAKEQKHLTSEELARRKIDDFLQSHHVEAHFNQQQSIILVASDFDEQTLSAVAWLNKNTVDISCYKIIPYMINEDTFLKVEKVLPTEDFDDFYVDLLDRSDTKRKRRKAPRRNLPRIKTMLDWGVVQPGDIIQAKGRENEGALLENGNILVDDEEKTLQKWLKDVFGWQSVQTYGFSIHKETGKSLSEIREEHMEQEEL